MSQALQYGRNRDTAKAFEKKRPVLMSAADMPIVGEVKWFEGKYGFLVREDGTEAFIHKSVISKYGLREADMIKGRHVRFCDEPRAGGRPEVTAIALL